MLSKQGLKLQATTVQKASSFPIGLVVRVTWAGSNNHFVATLGKNSIVLPHPLPSIAKNPWSATGLDIMANFRPCLKEVKKQG